MTKVEFNFRGTTTAIPCSENDIMKDICKKFAIKVEIDINDVYFLYSGNNLNLNLTYAQVANSLDKERKIMSIVVNDINPSTIIKDNSNIINSIYPICPQCKENILFEIKDYKINLYGCKNGHNFKDILINEYEKTQEIDLLKIECNECKIKKYNTYNHEMYKCNKCNKNICIACNQKHEHKTINYDLNIRCEKEHINHNIITYGSIIKDKDELINKLKEYKNDIDIFNNDINNIINKLNNVKKNIEIIYNIYNNMIINDIYRNYETIKCINNINNNNIIINEIKNINNIKNINYKIDNILNIYNKMNKININEITMIYNINNENKIKILDEDFIKNNKDKCKIIYENKEYDLIEEFNINNKNINKLEIKLYGINNITNMNSMFYECSALESLPDISIFDTSNVTDMSFLFYGCNSLKSLPDISIWNTSKVTNMKSMFCLCNSLKSLPDISKFDTSNVIDMSFLFYGCNSLNGIHLELVI